MKIFVKRPWGRKTRIPPRGRSGVIGIFDGSVQEWKVRESLQVEIEERAIPVMHPLGSEDAHTPGGGNNGAPRKDPIPGSSLYHRLKTWWSASASILPYRGCQQPEEKDAKFKMIEKTLSGGRR